MEMDNSCRCFSGQVCKEGVQHSGGYLRTCLVQTENDGFNFFNNPILCLEVKKVKLVEMLKVRALNLEGK